MTASPHIIGHAAQTNPFEITKAVDFTDREISSMWVDWPAPGGFAEFVSLKSPMARIIRGGKGTGRTHVMRHFSAPVQFIRGNEDPVEQVLKDGVLGIYVQCSGLNSSRFRGRGIDDDDWQAIFTQFMDVWLAQAALQAFSAVYKEHLPSDEIQSAITEEVRGLLNITDKNSGTSLSDLADDLFDMQRKVDLAVNNASLNPGGPLPSVVQASPGDLVFGVPNALKDHYEPIQGVTFLYLLDEFENFEIPQQQYVNSLVRDKKPGTSFMIGVRTYGLKTYETLNKGEENKHGSEFEEIRPDQYYAVANRNALYEKFCHRVVARRLSELGLLNYESEDSLRARLSEFFVVPSNDYEERMVISKYDNRERPYISRLKEQLANHAKATSGAPLTPRDIDFVVDAVRVPSRPLLEKTNTLLIYRAWHRGRNLIETAQQIIDERFSDQSGLVKPNADQMRILEKYSTDLKAQLCRDSRVHPIYAGIDQFIEMSHGLPRNLLVILKYIYRWAQFNEELPFRGGQISLESQRRGLLEAADWFLLDAKPVGNDGEDVLAAIRRLCDMFRRFRFSDKIVESSLTTFSADLTNCSDRTRDIVDLAEKWSLLVSVEGGQKQRNTGLIEPKFQINRLLSPRWDLPTARRGAIRFRTEEMDAIFAPQNANEFGRVLYGRLNRMRVPFGRRQVGDTLQQEFEWDG